MARRKPGEYGRRLPNTDPKVQHPGTLRLPSEDVEHGIFRTLQEIHRQRVRQQQTQVQGSRQPDPEE